MEALVQSSLDHLGKAFDAAVAKTAAMCSRGGKLNAQSLDRHQWICYELAWANADLLAAGTIVRSSATATTLDQELGIAFAIDAITSVLTRLQGIYVATELDASPLHEFSSGEVLRRLRAEAGCPDAMAKLGNAVVETGGDIAEVAVDEQTSMARDAFRRFATEVVAPLAEKIHRQDLTVPETLLTPMREMGAFGLSIPENYGGSSPPGQENTSMMIAVTEALSEVSPPRRSSSRAPRACTCSAVRWYRTTEVGIGHPGSPPGDPLCAIAITEPDYGSDVAALSRKGHSYPRRLGAPSGAKTWCTLAGKASSRRTNPDRSLGHRGLSPPAR